MKRIFVRSSSTILCAGIQEPVERLGPSLIERLVGQAFHLDESVAEKDTRFDTARANRISSVM